ncbi:MAG: sensor histidine kinase [Pseudomonadota bacterium]
MQFKHSLRRRIIVSFVIFAALLSLAIAIGVLLALEDIEETLVESALQAEMAHRLQQPLPPLGDHRRLTTTLSFYHVDERRRGELPDLVHGLPPGHHEVNVGNEIYYLYGAATEQGMAYILENATEFERREDALQTALFLTVAVATVVALWLSRWLAGRVITPLSTLAQQVSRLRPGATTPPVAAHYADDEVGQLARTFDAYQRRMEQFIRREQEFTADASHELRTPLAVINGACELLRENPDIPERARRQIERIDRAGERMSQMLESLLLLARETPSGEATDHSPCRVEEVVLEVIDQLRLLTHDKPLALRSEILSGFSLSTSRTALAIVLNNLIRNAINYTERGEVLVRVEDRRVAIIDSGCGIEEEELAHIFERHYRGNNVSHNGSGIGLSIVKRLCERQHWRIHIDSEPGRGTSVTIEF